MLHCYPDFYEDFRCIAGKCPDSCCYGWSVVVDDEAAAFYETLTGPLVQELRKAMTTDEDGDRVFRMQEGNCPFWTEDHLCRIELELGHEAPCATCRKFPRLAQDYGVFTEYGLTLACPQAARLILTRRTPWIFHTEGQPGDPQKVEFDWVLLLSLHETRQKMWQALWDPSASPREALRNCLRLGARTVSDKPMELSVSQALFELLRGLEILTPHWQELLDEALAADLSPVDFAALDAVTDWYMVRNLGACYISRYWFQAVADLDSLLRLQLLATNQVVIRRLACLRLKKAGRLTEEDLLRFYQLYAKEVEHDDVNRAALAEALIENPRFCLESMLSLL